MKNKKYKIGSIDRATEDMEVEGFGGRTKTIKKGKLCIMTDNKFIFFPHPNVLLKPDDDIEFIEEVDTRGISAYLYETFLHSFETESFEDANLDEHDVKNEITALLDEIFV